MIGATAITSFLPTQFESTLEDYVDAIDDMVERVGIQHVGIGSDYTQDQPKSFFRYLHSQQGTRFPATFVNPSIQYDEVAFYPRDREIPDKFPNLARDLETPDKLPNLAVALTARGYRPDEVTKILGENWLRLSK